MQKTFHKFCGPLFCSTVPTCQTVFLTRTTSKHAANVKIDTPPRTQTEQSLLNLHDDSFRMNLDFHNLTMSKNFRRFFLI